MATLRATQFFLGQVTGSGNHTVYTVPSGKRIVVHGISLQDISGSSSVVQFRIGTYGTIQATTLTGYPAVGSGVFWDPYVVVNALDTLVIGLPSGGNLSVVLSGTFLFV